MRSRIEMFYFVAHEEMMASPQNDFWRKVHMFRKGDSFFLKHHAEHPCTKDSRVYLKGNKCPRWLNYVGIVHLLGTSCFLVRSSCCM